MQGKLSDPGRRFLNLILASTLVVSVLRFAIPEVGEFFHSLLEGMKGDELTPLQEFLGTGDFLVWSGAALVGIVTLIRQVAEYIDSGVVERWMDALELLVIGGVATLLFFLSSAVVLLV